MVSGTVSRPNAARPVSISNSTQPNDQMSVRLSTGSARLLGTHVRGVPRMSPVSVPSTAIAGVACASG